MSQPTSFSRAHGIDSFARVAGAVLAPYQSRFDKSFEAVLPTLGDDVRVRQAIAYSLRSGGKRLRPAIVWMMADALHPAVTVDLAAVAVEFFHSSSLIIDDLPSMDNDDFRRGVPTTHKAFSEAIAIMASFALTAAGFELISRVPLGIKNEETVLRAIYQTASTGIGLQGLIGGQQLDLEPQGYDEAQIMKLIDLKTGALFDVCFVFGWLWGGGAVEKLDDLHRMSQHFGRAFQILDDIDDLEQDRAAGKKTSYALAFGEEAAKTQIRENVDQFCLLARRLGLEKSPLVTLTEAMRLATA
jgi:geranylgeranyl diphosphate synthase type II